MNKKILILIVTFIAFIAAAFLLYKFISAPKDTGIGLEQAPVLRASDEGALMDKAKALSAGGEFLKAKEIYLKIMEKFPASNIVPKAQEELEKLNVQILFSPVITEDSFSYEVEKGDSLFKIAKKFNTTPELIEKANGIKDSVLRFGKKIKVTRAKFSIVVDKSQNILTLKTGQEIVKTYTVSTGKNSSTPVGVFNITDKIKNPPWYPAGKEMIPAGDPRNILGSRWLGISKKSYGIHGTTQPETIGESVTEGCVRMKNADVEELYAIIPEGTEVVIID